eukprot:scaffold8701_cov101-Cylindrotheca_fusiformis.AAC.3
MDFVKEKKDQTETQAKETEAKALREYAEKGDSPEAEDKAAKLEKEVRQDRGEETMKDKAEDMGAKAREAASNAFGKAKEMGDKKSDEKGEKK